jgi:hypothetical protein
MVKRCGLRSGSCTAKSDEVLRVEEGQATAGFGERRARRLERGGKAKTKAYIGNARLLWVSGDG